MARWAMPTLFHVFAHFVDPGVVSRQQVIASGGIDGDRFFIVIHRDDLTIECRSGYRAGSPQIVHVMLGHPGLGRIVSDHYPVSHFKARPPFERDDLGRIRQILSDGLGGSHRLIPARRSVDADDILAPHLLTIQKQIGFIRAGSQKPHVAVGNAQSKIARPRSGHLIDPRRQIDRAATGFAHGVDGRLNGFGGVRLPRGVCEVRSLSDIDDGLQKPFGKLLHPGMIAREGEILQKTSLGIGKSRCPIIGIKLRAPASGCQAGQ